MLAERAFSFIMNTDFNSPKHLFADWILSILSFGFGIYAWWSWSWSFVWAAGGVLSIGLAVIRPQVWVQRHFRGMIKRPSN